MYITTHTYAYTYTNIHIYIYMYILYTYIYTYLRETRQLDVPDPVRGGAEERSELHVGHAHEPPREGELDTAIPCVCFVCFMLCVDGFASHILYTCKSVPGAGLTPARWNLTLTWVSGGPRRRSRTCFFLCCLGSCVVSERW